MIFADVETFGLDVEKDLVLEVGLRIMNLELTKEIASITIPIWSVRHSDRFSALRLDAKAGDEDAQFVVEMHRSNNLFNVASSSGISLAEAGRKIDAWITRNEVLASEPLCGSSVGYDRAVLKKYLPHIEKRFGYRDVNISSLKELCQATNPTMFAYMQPDVEATVDMTKPTHRVETCLDYSVAELKWYMDNFLYIPGGRFDS